MGRVLSGPDTAAPVIVTALMGAADFAWANDLRRRHFPPERNYLDAHITLFHHLPPARLPELKQWMRHLTQGAAAPSARLGGVIHLGRGVAYRVDSADLLALRADIADVFAHDLTPQDQASPRLHITVQNKVSAPESKALCAALEREFHPRPLAITGIAAYYYRGGPWELITKAMFKPR